MKDEFLDEDIKIADGFTGKKNTDDTDVLSTVSQLRRQKRLGNIDRAKEIGKNVAFILTGCRTAEQRMPGMDKNTALQCRCVMAFGIITGFERYIKNEILSRVALNSFYDSLRECDPVFYEQLNNLAAMSCYYLAARRNENVEKEIGPTFAMLCKADDNAEIIKLGNDLFKESLDITKNQTALNKLR